MTDKCRVRFLYRDRNQCLSYRVCNKCALKWEASKYQTFVVMKEYIVVETVYRINKEHRLRVLENRALRKTLPYKTEIAREGSRKPQ